MIFQKVIPTIEMDAAKNTDAKSPELIQRILIDLK